MKKIAKVLCLILVMVMLVAPVASFANDFREYADENGDIGGLSTDVGTIGKGVYGVLRTVGLIVAVCMVVYMGIQWILATPSKKAELKGRMWSMAIGVVLLLGGVGLLGVIQSAVEGTEIFGR